MNVDDWSAERRPAGGGTLRFKVWCCRDISQDKVMRAMSKKMANVPIEWLGEVRGLCFGTAWEADFQSLRIVVSLSITSVSSYILHGNLLWKKEGARRSISSKMFTCCYTQGSSAVDLYSPRKGPEIPFRVSRNVIDVTYLGLSLLKTP
jgi:hypothetical protein